MRVPCLLVALAVLDALAGPAPPPLLQPPAATHAAPVIRLLMALGKLESRQLLVMSCGSRLDVSAELRLLDWPTGVHRFLACFPCDDEALQFLFGQRRGLHLLLLHDERCLPRMRQHVHTHWAAGETLVVSAGSCSHTLAFPLFEKVMYPTCIELSANGTRFVLQRRHDGSLRRQRVHRVGGGLLLKQPDALLTRADLGGRTLIFLFENYNPFFECRQQRDRLCVDMLDTPPRLLIENLAARLNFRAVFLRGPDGSWGHEEDGVWKGMVGEVARGEADFAVGGLFVTAKRQTVVDFAQEFALVYVNIITRPVPVAVRNDMSQMLAPIVWLLIVIGLLLTAAALWLSKVVSGNAAYRPAGRAAAAIISELEDAYRILAAQDIGLRRLVIGSSRLSLALLLAIWLVAGIVNRTAYTSKLISILSQPPASWAPETFQDLVDYEYDVVTHHGYGTYTDWMNAQTGPLFVKLKQRWIRGDRVQAFRELSTTRNRLALLEETPGAFSLLYDTIAETRGRVTPADMHIGRERFFPSNVAWAMQKNTPYAPHMNRLIKLMRQFGLVDKWMRDIEQVKVRAARRETIKACRRQPRLCLSRRATPLSINKVASAFFFLAYGYAAAALLVLLENVAALCRRRRKGGTTPAGRLFLGQ